MKITNESIIYLTNSKYRTSMPLAMEITQGVEKYIPNDMLNELTRFDNFICFVDRFQADNWIRELEQAEPVLNMLRDICEDDLEHYSQLLLYTNVRLDNQQNLYTVSLCQRYPGSGTDLLILKESGSLEQKPVYFNSEEALGLSTHFAPKGENCHLIIYNDIPYIVTYRENHKYQLHCYRIFDGILVENVITNYKSDDISQSKTNIKRVLDKNAEGAKNNTISCSNRIAHQALSESTNAYKAGIGGLGIATKGDFFDLLYSAFNFDQSNYTDSESDIMKGMKDLSWLDAKHIHLFIWDHDKMLLGRPESKAGLIQMFEQDIAPYWARREGHSFQLYLVSESGQPEQGKERKGLSGARIEKGNAVSASMSPVSMEAEEISVQSALRKVQYIRRSEKSLLETNARMDRKVFLTEIGGRDLRSKRDFMYAMQAAFRFPEDWNGVEENYIQSMRDLSWLEEKASVIVVINNIQETASEQTREYVIDSFENEIFPHVGQDKCFDVYWVEK